VKRDIVKGSRAAVVLLLCMVCSCGWFSSPPVEITDGESDGPDMPEGWDGDVPPDGWEALDGQDTDWDGGDMPRLHISGTIYEDLNGDGELSDGLAAASVDVMLYRDGGDGNPDGADDTFQSQAVTGSAGRYDFVAAAGAAYWVAVDSRSLRASGGFNAGYGPRSAWPEQTHGPAGALCAQWSGGSTSLSAPGRCFGGRRGSVPDDAAALGSAEHVALVALSTADMVDVSFGFSFNVVTNPADGMLDDGSGYAVQGSLRQFIVNANAIRGANVMHFVPAAAPQMGGSEGSWWRIEVSAALPSIDDSATTVDGRAFDLSDGASQRDSLPGSLGTGGTVGVDGLTLPRVARPELEIKGIGTVESGIVIKGDNAVIQHLSVNSFALVMISGQIVVDSADGALIRSCIIGTGPESFSMPDGEITEGSGIETSNADNGTISENLIGFCGGAGIRTWDNSVGWSVLSNELRGNAALDEAYDGIDTGPGSSGFTIRGNLLVGNLGGGIDTYESAGGHTMENNTVTENGYGGTETFGIRLFGERTTVSRNLIHDNAGPGVLVTMLDTDDARTPGFYHEISQNRFGGNGSNAIDLVGSGSNRTGDGVTVNDGGYGDPCGYMDTSGNAGLDYPEILETHLNGSGTLLTIRGTACPGSTVEVYRAEAGAGDSSSTGLDCGEGVEFLGFLAVGTDGSFSGSMGVVLNASQEVSVIAVDAQGNTSEFSENARAGGGD
jgi:parallel beta-helix repeat protein